MIVHEIGPLEFDGRQVWMSGFQVLALHTAGIALADIRPSLLARLQALWPNNAILDVRQPHERIGQEIFMADKIQLELGNVQKTLLLPLWGRAIETQKPLPLLIDRAAAQIIEKLEYDFSESARHLSAISQLGWIARSLHIDAAIKRLLETHPTATIVNLGCGLDTTFDRVDNGCLTWYDLDLPDVMALRKQLIPEQERRMYIADSLFSHDWLAQVNSEKKVLFVVAGVLYYFEETRIRAFVNHLAGRFPGAELIFDASSPIGIKMANKMVIKASGMDEKSFLQWGLPSVKTLELWDQRINIIAKYPMFGALKKHFQFKDRMTAWLSDVLNMQFMVHVRFGKEGIRESDRSEQGDNLAPPLTISIDK
ncbi:MAG: class I SAM-dependent methyltransferase [Deltaproteobacteria bacterium]|nr:class I SAM-dependent methyltransferase [Deltaproteobacteria bacterium]